MAFFLGLICISFFLWLISRILRKNRFLQFDRAARLATAIMFVQVGIFHLVNPDALVYMVEFLPYPKLLVIISGITEILLGLGLLLKKSRVICARLLILQLLLMFPANIYVALNNLSAPGALPADPWYTWSRLLFQPVYIFWIYYFFFSSEKNKQKVEQKNMRKPVTSKP